MWRLEFRAPIPLEILRLDFAFRGHRVEQKFALRPDVKAAAYRTVQNFAHRARDDFVVLAALCAHSQKAVAQVLAVDVRQVSEIAVCGVVLERAELHIEERDFLEVHEPLGRREPRGVFGGVEDTRDPRAARSQILIQVRLFGGIGHKRLRLELEGLAVARYKIEIFESRHRDVLEHAVDGKIDRLVRAAVWVRSAKLGDFVHRQVVGFEIGVELEENGGVAVAAECAGGVVVAEFFGGEIRGDKSLGDKG